MWITGSASYLTFLGKASLCGPHNDDRSIGIRPRPAKSLSAVRNPGPEKSQTPSCADGVEREMVSSSSVMSAGISANSGVLR
jgi:hypothetical protein